MTLVQAHRRRLAVFKCFEDRTPQSDICARYGLAPAYVRNLFYAWGGAAENDVLRSERNHKLYTDRVKFGMSYDVLSALYGVTRDYAKQVVCKERKRNANLS